MIYIHVIITKLFQSYTCTIQFISTGENLVMQWPSMLHGPWRKKLKGRYKNQWLTYLVLWTRSHQGTCIMIKYYMYVLALTLLLSTWRKVFGFFCPFWLWKNNMMSSICTPWYPFTYPTCTPWSLCIFFLDLSIHTPT